MNLNFDTLAFENCDIAASKLAFACSNGDLTWLSFSEQVHSLIEVFQSISLPKGHPVMIYGHKEKLFPVAITACLCYGVPYIPIDIMLPFQRINKIQELSGSQVMINCTDEVIDYPTQLKIDNKHIDALPA